MHVNRSALCYNIHEEKMSNEKQEGEMFDSVKSAKSAQRKAHFANGHSAKSWCPPTKTLDNGSCKHKKNKEACRKPVEGE